MDVKATWTQCKNGKNIEQVVICIGSAGIYIVKFLYQGTLAITEKAQKWIVILWKSEGL